MSSLPISFSELFTAEHDVRWHGTSLRSDLLAVSPPASCLPQLTHWGRYGEGESLELGKQWSTTAKLLLCLSTLFQPQIQRTAPHGLLWRKLAPSQLDPVKPNPREVSICLRGWIINKEQRLIQG